MSTTKADLITDLYKLLRRHSADVRDQETFITCQELQDIIYDHEDKLDLRNSKMREISINTDEDQGGHERECSDEREADGIDYKFLPHQKLIMEDNKNTSFGALAQPDSCPCPPDIKPVKLDYDADKSHG